MGDEASFTALTVLGDTAADLHAAIADAGWTTGGSAVLVADARTGMAAVVDADDRARRDGAALVAVVSEQAEVDAAYAAGATHAAVGLGQLAATLRFAGRHARRVRGEGRQRRRDDLDATSGGAGCVVAAALTSVEIVNRAFGRGAGDRVMAEAEARVANLSAATDTSIVRDGSRFIVALPDRGPAQALANALEAALAAPYLLGNEAVQVGVRMAVVVRSAGDPPGVWQRRVEEALAGNGAMATAAVAPADAGRIDALAADLTRALDRQEIEVLFQPQVLIATGRIAGVEALARWRHATLGTLGAGDLLAAAARADLGTAVSDHIQARALAEVAGWPEALAGLRVAVNVTAADVARAEFARRFLERVDASGVARARVTAEITEDGLIANLDAAANLLAQLRGAGCRVAIDDFGTGYSSLAYLKALPLDYLKVDRRLTQDITGDERDRVVVRGVLAMARSLGLETIAEGVETAEQRDALAAERCTYFQGFLCSPPVDSAALATLVSGG